MKQVYLNPRGSTAPRLRSDTLFGLIAIGVREVFGRESLEQFLAPLRQSPAEAPLRLTSTFPFVQRGDAKVHYFPRPIEPGAPDEQWIEDRDLLAIVSGRDAIDVAPHRELPRCDGLFFLVEGKGEPWLEGALSYLERAGFGGGTYRVELREAEFLRTAHAGELGVALSLFLPTDAERAAIAAAVDEDSAVRYGVCRRAGTIDRGRFSADTPRKRAVTMMTEGSVLPVSSRDPGSAAVVGAADDGQGPFEVIQHGFGFFVPVAGDPS